MYILLFLCFILVVLIERIIKYGRNEKLGWKAYKKNNNLIIYSEKINNKWSEIQIDADINIGTFEPKFKNDSEWKVYPKWAHDREKIINRVKEKFPLKNEISEIGVDKD